MGHSSIDNFIKRKKAAKKALSEKFNFHGKRPVLGLIFDKELSKNEEEILVRILEGILKTDLKVVIVADGSAEWLSSNEVIVLPYNRINRKEILEAADMALSFSFNDVEEMLLHGTIPISSKRPEVSDYNPNQETGNSFVYKQADQWSIFAAVVRALETFKFPYDWNNIIRQGMESVAEKEV